MEKILFIDDEQEILDLLKDYFKNLYEVYTATTFNDAINLIDSTDFDCVVSDVNLIEAEGFEIVSYIKQKNKNLPVLLLSGLTQEEMILKGFDVGADDYIRKPFSCAELNARISTRLNKNKKKKYIFGDLEIDESAMQVRYKQNIIPLTSMEFDILLLLVKNEGITYNKEEIYNEIWKQEPLDQMHTVQVHMFTLRKKLQDFTGIEYIKTIWKKGYMFCWEKEKKE